MGSSSTNAPSCPVFIAVNNDWASGPLTSPTNILSGLILNVFLIKSSIVISYPSIPGLAGRVSIFTTCLCGICNSGVSSTVMILSVYIENNETTLSVVVLPEPVPPAINVFAGFEPK